MNPLFVRIPRDLELILRSGKVLESIEVSPANTEIRRMKLHTLLGRWGVCSGLLQCVEMRSISRCASDLEQRCSVCAAEDRVDEVLGEGVGVAVGVEGVVGEACLFEGEAVE